MFNGVSLIQFFGTHDPSLQIFGHLPVCKQLQNSEHSKKQCLLNSKQDVWEKKLGDEETEICEIIGSWFFENVDVRKIVDSIF